MVAVDSEVVLEAEPEAEVEVDSAVELEVDSEEVSRKYVFIITYNTI